VQVDIHDDAALAGLMAGCDAVVVPSIWWENAPLVVREAAAAGVLIIGADLGGLRLVDAGRFRGATISREQAGQLTLQLEGFSTRRRWSPSTP
jgi:glycosyltransferase involved in cell wall biosynthesis